MKKNNILIKIILIILFFSVLFFFYIFIKNIEKESYIDKDNTEKIIDQNSLDEIEKNLEDLDISLEDILNELDL